LRVEVRVASKDALELDYRLEGELSRARIPTPLGPERVDGLWCHTCFETFVGGNDRSDYLEYNLAPSGQWQAYEFSEYRQNRRLPRTESPSIQCSRSPCELRLQASIRLPESKASGRLRLGLCAVLEDTDGALSYWALRHANGPPDFHDPSTFVTTPAGV
jgi:hypothetical protein